MSSLLTVVVVFQMINRIRRRSYFGFPLWRKMDLKRRKSIISIADGGKQEKVGLMSVWVERREGRRKCNDVRVASWKEEEKWG